MSGIVFPRARHSHASSAGFTLIEILVAMAVLVLGLASVLSLVLGSGRMADSAVDRNMAATIIPLAVEDIQRTLLITKGMDQTKLWTCRALGPADYGLLLVTNPVDPTVTVLRVRDAIPNILPTGSAANQFPTPNPNPSTEMWPFRTDFPNLSVSSRVPPFYLASPVSVGGSLYRQSSTSTQQENFSSAYRVLFRLERHPDWVAVGESSEFAGIYVLSLTAYRDLARDASRLIQISDPTVIFLRDKKVHKP